MAAFAMALYACNQTSPHSVCMLMYYPEAATSLCAPVDAETITVGLAYGTDSRRSACSRPRHMRAKGEHIFVACNMFTKVKAHA